MSTTDKLKSIVKASSYSDLEERKAYNESINVIPESFKGIKLIGPKGVLVRLYKFTEHTSTKGGLVTQKYKNYTKDSGRAGVTLDDFVYQARAMVVSVSPEAQKYINDNWEKDNVEAFKPGTTVWIHPGNGVSPSNQFLYDRTHPVVEEIDYLILHPNHIEAIEAETTVFDVEYADKIDEDVELLSENS